MVAEPVIRVDNLTFSYNGSPVLQDVDLSIGQNDFAYIVGPNGGGKTTLLKLMLGLLEPQRGSVRIFGQPPDEARKRIGYVPQHYQYDDLFPVRVIDIVLMGRIDRSPFIGPYSRTDKAAAFEALQQVEMLDLRKRSLSELSGGQRQRVFIARALASQPEVLLMDEPMANLDLEVEAGLFELLRSLNQRLTVAMVSHDVGFVSQVVTKVICVNRRVFVHTTSQITPEMICEMYGRDVRVVRHDDRGGEHTHA